MKWIKQSFAFLRAHPKESLILSFLGLLLLIISNLVPLFGVALTSLGLVLLQAGVFQALIRSHGQTIKMTDLAIKPSVALTLGAFIMIPTNVMMGSISGLAHGSESVWLSLFMLVVFTMMCALAYLTIAHTLGFIVAKKLRFGLALEAALQGVVVHRLKFLNLSCLSAVALLLSVLPLGRLTGLGLIVTLPLHAYLYYFSFRDLYLSDSAQI